MKYVIASKNLVLEDSKMESVSNSKGKGGLVGIGEVLSFDKEKKSVTIIEPADDVFLNNSNITTAGWLEMSDEAGKITLGANHIELRKTRKISSPFTYVPRTCRGEPYVRPSYIGTNTLFVRGRTPKSMIYD